MDDPSQPNGFTFRPGDIVPTKPPAWTTGADLGSIDMIKCANVPVWGSPAPASILAPLLTLAISRYSVRIMSGITVNSRAIRPGRTEKRAAIGSKDCVQF